ncbi:hypothetical protein GB937_010349 [Aspergillus fischeri]|nr:hypothetical protein GB937_010349 [Aspergillus fischeri]
MPIIRSSVRLKGFLPNTTALSAIAPTRLIPPVPLHSTVSMEPPRPRRPEIISMPLLHPEDMC